jgi:threonine/homoserine/homoserine lactone efflux protein
VHLLLLPVLGYGLGFVAAIPIGATQVEIAKRALADRLVAAAMVVLGSVLSDSLYGVIALYGLAPFFRHRAVVAGFSLVGAVLLTVLGVLTFRENARAQTLDLSNPALGNRPLALVTGFSLAVTNPPMILWWLVGAKIATDPALGIVHAFTRRSASVFLLAGALGIGSYLLLLAFIVRRIKHMITPATHRRVNHVLGFLLFALAFLMLAAAVRDLR